MADLDYVKVTARLGLTVGDGADPDETPDTVWCDEGIVRLVPLNTYTKVAGGSPSPWTAGHSVIEAPVSPDGFMSWSGQPHVWVVDLTSAKVNPFIGAGKATHRIEFKNVKSNGTPVAFETQNVRLAADAVDPVTGAVDLTLALPVPTAGGTPITVGPQGVGVAGMSVVAGELEVELTNGDTLNAGELPVGPGGSDAGVAGYLGDPESESAVVLAAKMGTLIEDEDIPGQVESGISSSPTLVAAATAAANAAAPAAVTSDLATRPGLPKTTIREDVAVSFTDEDGHRYWLEAGSDGGPTTYSLAMLAEKGVGPIVGPTGAVMASTSLADMAVFGDSTARCSNHEGQGWDILLGNMLGRSIANYGASGTIMSQISAKAGGRVVTCYANGGTIPADTATPVTLTSWSPYKILGSVDVETCPVTLRFRDGSTVQGTLSQVSGDMVTVAFNRTTAGAAITTNGQVEVFSRTAQQAKTIILAGGVNDEGYLPTRTADDVLAEYANVASVLAPIKPRLMVWGPLDRGIAEAAGTQNGDFIRAIEAGLRKIFGSNFCEVRRYLASAQALLDAALITPGFVATSDDNAAVAAGTIPPSFRDPTSVHLNATLGYPLQARFMYRWLTSPMKAWY